MAKFTPGGFGVETGPATKGSTAIAYGPSRIGGVPGAAVYISCVQVLGAIQTGTRWSLVSQTSKMGVCVKEH